MHGNPRHLIVTQHRAHRIHREVHVRLNTLLHGRLSGAGTAVGLGLLTLPQRGARYWAGQPMPRRHGMVDAKFSQRRAGPYRGAQNSRI